MRRSRTLWEEGREPGWQVVALGLAGALTAVVLDVAVTGRLGLLFDLVFVVLCVALALVVRPGDFFTVGVLPPLVMVAVLLLLGATTPGAFARPDDGVVQAVVTGLSTHSIALVVGYALCLTLLAVRHRVLAVSPRSATGPPHHGG